MAFSISKYTMMSSSEVIINLAASPDGLKDASIAKRQKQYGLNTIHVNKLNAWLILWRQAISNPLTIVLTVATIISYFMGQRVSAYYIFGMILLSIGLGFWNEYAAEKTVKNLLKKISLMAIVIRNKTKQEILVNQITVGDIVLLAPGSIVPADLRLLEVGGLELDESSLTGESITVYKNADLLKRTPKSLSECKNICFMGTIVTSGWGRGIVLDIGANTEFGKIAEDVSFIKPATEFQNGLHKFSSLIIKVIAILTAAIFSVNWLLGNPLLDSLIFALAIAVGLTPELLPVIVTISLSHGAGKLAKKHVISKQLVAIENLGNMDVLCTDKTGTLTEGVIKVSAMINAYNKDDPEILRLSLACNSAVKHHKFIGNAIDIALCQHAEKTKIKLPADFTKITEEPFDYRRQLMFCVADYDGQRQLISKGSPETILSKCKPSLQVVQAHNLNLTLSKQGLRIIAVATKPIDKKSDYNWDDLDNLEFRGFIALADVAKKSTKLSLRKLEALGVDIKIITGDSEVTTEYICNEVGLPIKRIITGLELAQLHGSNLSAAVAEANIFARVTPEQKKLIIQSLKDMGHTVGFLGDGINDIPSLHNADVGISVNTAVDVAKDASQIVLLHKGLDIVAAGIIEGRRTFNNTIKYILMGTSSNFGNMFSAAGASFFLPFLPMLPSQILLTNALYDISQIAIPSDNVDPESLKKPRHWNIKFIKYYMLFFGPISSLYDFLTFGIMIYLFHANAATFQTGWFVESLATEILVIFMIRTSRVPFYKSKPSRGLIVACLSIVGIGLYLPYSPLASSLGFVPLPGLYFLCLIGLVATYLLIISQLKALFLRRYSL